MEVDDVLDHLYSKAEETFLACETTGGRLWALTVSDRTSNHTVHHRRGYCVPWQCSERHLQMASVRTIAPMFTPFEVRVHVDGELALWRSLSVDFLIAGVDSCGTSSLRRNLAQHPEITFS